MPQNNVEAVKWYRKAADQGYRDAQFNLASIYASGLGYRKIMYRRTCGSTWQLWRVIRKRQNTEP